MNGTTTTRKALTAIVGGMSIAAASSVALTAPAAARPSPACTAIARGAWIETLCSTHTTEDQCETAKQARGGLYEFFAVTPTGLQLQRDPLTCIGPIGGASDTATVRGTSDGLWHLSHIGP